MKGDPQGGSFIRANFQLLPLGVVGETCCIVRSCATGEVLRYGNLRKTCRETGSLAAVDSLTSKLQDGPESGPLYQAMPRGSRTEIRFALNLTGSPE